MPLASRLLNLREQILRGAKSGNQVEGELHAIIFQIGNSACGTHIKDALDYAEDYYGRDGGSERLLSQLAEVLLRAAECLETPDGA